MGKEEKVLTQPTKEEIRQERVKRAEEERIQKEMIKKFTDLKTKLELLSKSQTDLLSKNKKDIPIRAEIQELIKSADYKFEGRSNIGKTTKISSFIKLLEDGSKVQVEKLKQLQAPTSVKYDEEIRNPPRTKGNIKTLKSAGGGAAGAISSRI